MDHELLKRLLDFLADQGAQLNRWEAKRLALGLDASETRSWQIKDRGFIDYLVERCLYKDRTFWNLSEKIWQVAFECGPLYQLFLYSPFQPWLDWKKEICHELRQLIVQESAAKRMTHFSPAQIETWVVAVAKKSQIAAQIQLVASEKQFEHWQYILHGKALMAQYEDLQTENQSLTHHLHSAHAQIVPLAKKFELVELTQHQLNLLYRLRARQQIETLIQKFYSQAVSSFPKSE